MYIKDKLELALLLYPPSFEKLNLQEEENSNNQILANIMKNIFLQKYDILVPNNILYLYYELRQIKKNDQQAKKILMNLLNLGVDSLTILQRMEPNDLENFGLQECIQHFGLTPDFQCYLYDNFMVPNLNLDNSIYLLKQNNILTIDKFFQQEACFVQKNLSLPKYKFLYLKEEYLNKKDFKNKNYEQENNFQHQGLRTQCQNGSTGVESTKDLNEIPSLRSNEDKSTSDVGFLKISSKEDAIKLSKLLYTIENQQIKQFPNHCQFYDQSSRDIKSILFVGETGAGKTTLINSILNFHFQIQFNEDIRLVFSECSKYNNKTNEIKTYYIPPFNNKPELLLIDTPGFGRARDETLSKEIQNFLITQLKHISLICIVIPASVPRLSVQEHSVLNYIQQMFGTNFVNNCIFVFTFSDQGEPQALESLTFKGESKYKESPVAKLISQIGQNWWIKLNNQALFAERSNTLSSIQWNYNMNSLQKLYESKIMTVKNLSRQFFKQSYIITNTTLEGTFSFHKKQLKEIIAKIQYLKTFYKSKFSKSQNQQSEVIVLDQVKESSQEYGINCNQCKITCFYLNYNCDAIQSIIKLIDDQNTCICKCQFQNHVEEYYTYNLQEKVILFKSNNWQQEFATLYHTQLILCFNTFWRTLLIYKSMTKSQYKLVWDPKQDFQNLVQSDKKNFLKDIKDQMSDQIFAELKLAYRLRSIDDLIEYMGL